MNRPFFWLLALLAAVTPAAAAEHWSPDGDTCNQMATTPDIADCIMARTKIWDARLNQAYKTLTTMLQDPSSKDQLAPLKPAQLAWIKYRDLNCAYYAAGQGTIRQITYASCLRDMTQARAIELQAIGPN